MYPGAPVLGLSCPSGKRVVSGPATVFVLGSCFSKCNPSHQCFPVACHKHCGVGFFWESAQPQLLFWLCPRSAAKLVLPYPVCFLLSQVLSGLWTAPLVTLLLAVVVPVECQPGACSAGKQFFSFIKYRKPWRHAVLPSVVNI